MKHFTVGAIVTGTLIASATAWASGGTYGSNISGALLENPARLGFSRSFTTATDTDINVPGTDTASKYINKWYNEDTKRLEIRLDFTSPEKANETMAMFDEAMESLSDAELRVNTGLSVGRLGLGVVAKSMTNVDSSSTSTANEDSPIGYDINLNAKANALARADSVAAFGIPIGKKFAVGASAKYTALLSEHLNFKASTENMTNEQDVLSPEESGDLGQGFLFDAGALFDAGLVQVDAVLKDIGSLKWSDANLLETKGLQVSDSAAPLSLMHFAGGITLKPSHIYSLGAWYDENLFGKGKVNTRLELKPFKWLSLRGGYISDPNFKNGTITLGGGLNLWALGLDTGASIKDGFVTGLNARVSLGF